MSMQRFIHIIRGLLSIVLTACSFGDEPAICPYNTRLEYWYAGSGTQNMLPTYVDNLRQYLFDADGQLLSEITLRGDSISGWQGELKDGTYTFVLWGNLGETNEQIITTKSNMNINEMTLSAEQQGIPPGYRGNTDRLYYGTATVEVKNGAAQRRRIYLSHAHAAMTITVRWMTDEPADGIFRMRLKGIPALYSFNGSEANPVPSGDGTYSLPYIGNKIAYHETRAAMNYEGEVIGEFVTFRYTSSTHQLWSLWRDGGELYGRGTTKRRTTCTGGRKRCHYTAGSDAQFKKQTGTRPGENQRRNNRFRRRECHLGPRCICVRFRNGKRRLLFHGTVRLPTIIKQQ